MTIVEEMARYIAARLALPFEAMAAGAAVFFGCLPEAPARAVCVTAGGLRPEGDDEGSRVQVIVRSDDDSGWALETAARLTALLDEARDIAFLPGGHYVSRIETARPFEFIALAENNAQFYTAEFTVYDCA